MGQSGINRVQDRDAKGVSPERNEFPESDGSRQILLKRVDDIKKHLHRFVEETKTCGNQKIFLTEWGLLWQLYFLGDCRPILLCSKTTLILSNYSVEDQQSQNYMFNNQFWCEPIRFWPVLINAYPSGPGTNNCYIRVLMIYSSLASSLLHLSEASFHL